MKPMDVEDKTSELEDAATWGKTSQNGTKQRKKSMRFDDDWDAEEEKDFEGHWGARI